MSGFMPSMSPMVGGYQFAPGNVQWVVTPQEKSNYDSQFEKLNSIGGFVRGDQARNFFLQSNLPPTVLGQIWELADLNGDGKMDKHEFSIAMKLIKLKLQGVMLPMVLPMSMKQQPSAFGTAGLDVGGGGMSTSSYTMSNGTIMSSSTVTSGLPTATISAAHNKPANSDSSSRSSAEWSVPKQSKLKYNQLFNSNDRAKIGYLSSLQARHILTGTGLPQMTLAKIWQLSDIDNDGKLSQEEFVLAMHLSDMAKAGQQIPNTLPIHLVPPSYRTAPTSQALPSGQLGLLTPLTQMDPENKAAPSNDTGSIFTTFEDKRRDNFQKGNLELEKRRLALLEIQQKEKERLEQKEREEREKREKERMEQERKRQQELEKQLERQREAEREREEQRRKAIEQKEAAQREMERQRQMEWERLRRKELLQQKLREQEAVVSLRAKTKTLDVELNSQQEKKSQLDQRVVDLEARLHEQNSQLNELNRQRELKAAQVHKQQEQVESFNQQLNSLFPAKQNLSEKTQFKNTPGEDNDLQMSQREYQSKVFTLQRLRTELEEVERLKLQQTTELERFNTELNQLREEMNKEKLSMENLNRIQQDKLRDLQEARRQKDISSTKQSFFEESAKQKDLFDAGFFHKQETASGSKISLPGKDQEQKRRDEQERKRLQEEENKRREEANKRRKEEENKRREEEKLKKEEEERKIRFQKFEEAKKLAEQTRLEEERQKAKAAEVQKKVEEMRKERMKQKQKQAAIAAAAAAVATTAASTKSGSNQSGQKGGGFQLNLSKDPANLVKYRALYDFTARNPDELSLNANDIIIVDASQNAEPDWLAGTKDDKSGWFPANYVEKIPGPVIEPPPQSAKPTKTSDNQQPFGMGQQSAFSATQKSQTQSNSASSSAPPDVGLRYRAIYPWIAKKENHLTFDKDDIIAVSEKEEMWWFGHCKGKSGWFPKSYVKVTTSNTPIVAQQPEPPKSSPVLKRKAPPPPNKLSQSNQEKKYIASYAFQGTEDGDLSFNAGDVITVSITDGEWWTGTLNGSTGIFPANYVSPYKPVQQTQQEQVQNHQESHTTQQQSKTTTLSKPEVATVIASYQASGPEQLSLQVGQVVSVRKKNENGWWEGELQARGKKRQLGWFPADYVKLMTAAGSSGKSTITSDKSKLQKPDVCRVMAMYDYLAQNPDELNFNRGDVITVEDKSDPDWWKGTLGSATGLFPSNYVQEISGGRSARSSPFLKENEYQHRVMELISSEETYLKDLQLADQAFQQPLREKGLLTEQECNTLFVNLNELIMASAKLARAFRVRCKMTRDNLSSIMIGDILCEQIPHLHPYIRFCSCQLNASALLQEKLDQSSEFKAFVKKCESGDLWKGLPVSSYLVKPMQRVTKYPLLIKKIIETTTQDHPDYHNLTRALEKTEELCTQVNEGVREKENSDRLEWLQTRVQLDGLNDKLIFNSKTNCLDQRKFLHCGTLYKHKSSKELIGFLFNDFLLLTTPSKPLNGPANDKLFTLKTNPQFKMYKQPIFLNEVVVKLPPDSTSEEPVFHLIHIEKVYVLRTDNVNERTSWMNKIKEAADLYIDTEKKKREKANQLRTQRSSGIGRLVVKIVEGCNLVKTSNGRHDPYCEVTMGEQCHITKTVQDTLNPKWNSSMQFFVKDINLDVLCISVFQRYMFSPDDFLGRTEVKLVDIHRQTQATKEPITKRLLLHEVDAGEVVVNLALLLFEKST